MKSEFKNPMDTDIIDLPDFWLCAQDIAMTADLGERFYDLFTELGYSSVHMISEFAHLTDEHFGDYGMSPEALQRAQAFAKAKIAEKLAAEDDGGAERMKEAKEHFFALFGGFFEDQDLFVYCAGGGDPDRIVSARDCAGYFAAVHGWIDIQAEYDRRTVEAYYHQYLHQSLDQFVEELEPPGSDEDCGACSIGNDNLQFRPHHG